MSCEKESFQIPLDSPADIIDVYALVKSGGDTRALAQEIISVGAMRADIVGIYAMISIKREDYSKLLGIEDIKIDTASVRRQSSFPAGLPDATDD